jgi:hypothetical protein
MTTATATDLKLYRPETIATDWPHRGYRWRGVRVTWLVWHRDEPVGDYRDLLDGYYERTSYKGETYVAGTDIVDELFTAAEAEQFAAYLKAAHGEDVTLTEVSLPVPIGDDPDACDYMAYSASTFGGPVDLHMLWEEDGYSLPFKVGGYYSMERDGQEPVAIKRLVNCPHHGEEYIDVVPCDPVNAIRRQAPAVGVDGWPF